MVSPEGIDAVKPSPKGEGAPLIPPGEPRRDECRGVVSPEGIEPNRTLRLELL